MLRVPRYRIALPVTGNLPASIQPLNLPLGGDSQLVFDDNRWRLTIELESVNPSQAVEQARQVATTDLTLFQIFSLGLVASFTMFVANNSEADIEEIGSPLRRLVSNSVTVTVYSEAPDAVFAGESIGTRLQQIRTVHNLAGQDDCNIALHYYGVAAREQDTTYKFLNFITTIEAMLSEGDETTEKISRRLAVLVSSKYNDMQETFSRFKRFYHTRSEILHGGKIPTISNETITQVSELAQVAIRSYLLLRVNSNNQEIKQKLDKFFDESAIAQIRTVTA